MVSNLKEHAICNTTGYLGSLLDYCIVLEPYIWFQRFVEGEVSSYLNCHGDCSYSYQKQDAFIGLCLSTGVLIRFMVRLSNCCSNFYYVVVISRNIVEVLMLRESIFVLISIMYVNHGSYLFGDCSILKRYICGKLRS